MFKGLDTINAHVIKRKEENYLSSLISLNPRYPPKVLPLNYCGLPKP